MALNYAARVNINRLSLYTRKFNMHVLLAGTQNKHIVIMYMMSLCIRINVPINCFRFAYMIIIIKVIIYNLCGK